jgi:hypothetical protein
LVSLLPVKATGPAAVVGMIVESLFSPLLWLLAISFFGLCFAASRLGNKPLRIILFWIPALTVSSHGVAFAALIAYVSIRFRNP